VTRSDDSAPPRRVLVALEAEEGADALLEAAASLAAALHAELAGIFVEDSELLAAASQPATRTVPTHAVGRGASEAGTLRRGLKISAARAGEALAAVARRRRIKYSYRVVQGALAELVLAEARRTDLVALGPSGRAVRQARVTVTGCTVAAQAPCSVLLLQGAGAGARPVVVVYEGAEAALALGERLARIYRRPLLVLAVAEREAAAAELAARARDWERHHHGRARVIGAVGESAAEFRTTLEAQHPGILVLDPERGLVAKFGLEVLLGELRCSVFVSR
jgi:hypothetical protein